MLDYRKINYFLKVADTLNISRTAEQLQISHQGLSKQIRALEDELGVPLLERNSSGLAMTEVGKMVNEWFRPIITEGDYRYQQLLKFIEGKKNTINLGYFNALSYRQCVYPIIDTLNAQHPNLHTEVLATDLGHVKQLLYSDKLDLIVTIMIDEAEWDDVSHATLMTTPFKILVSDKHPWHHKEFVTADDVKNESLLVYTSGSPYFFSNMDVKERVHCYNFDSYITRLEDGDAFGIVADIYSKREGNFRLLDLPECYQASCSIALAYRKEHPLRKVFQSLYEKKSNIIS